MADINWATVGVAWALSMLTMGIVFVVYKVIKFLRFRRRKRLPLPNAEKKENGHQSVPLVEIRCPTESQINDRTCRNPLLSAASRPNNQPNDRRKQDDVSRWCSEHGLPENIVYTLREQGFETKDALDALRPEDLKGQNGSPALLELPNKAATVQLRNVLTKIHGDSSTRNSKRSTMSESSSTRGNRGLLHTISDESDVTMTQSPGVSSDVFPAKSMDETDSGYHHDGKQRTRPKPSIQTKTSNNNNDHVQRFHGLLSDEGLWELAKLLGHEWRQLATHLNISAKTQEQLLETYHFQVKRAIHEMLTMWRDNCSGNKEQMKGHLHNALLKTERKDIANRIMHEQLHGSDEKVNKKVTSII